MTASASNAGGDSPYSAASPRVYTHPKALTNLTASFISVGQVNLTWGSDYPLAYYAYPEQSPDGQTWHQIPTAYIGGGGNGTYQATGPFTPSTLIGPGNLSGCANPRRRCNR